MKKYYFLTVSILMLIFSLIGFSDNLITDVGQKSNSDPKFIIHGLFCFAWFIMLIVQTNLVKQGNIKAHMTLGISGLVVAIGVFTTTIYIFAVVFKGWHVMPSYVKANRFFMPSYALVVCLGYLYRKRTAIHKRLMLVASFYMLEPILDRALGHIFPDELISSTIGWGVFIIGFWSLFFISLFIYDLLALKKIHPVTYLGSIWFCVVWMIVTNP